MVSGPDVNGVTFSAGNKAETQDVVQAGTYTFQFGADYNGQGCGEADTIEVIFEKALVLTPKDIEVCNDENQPLPNEINLDTLLTEWRCLYGYMDDGEGPGTPGGTLPVQNYKDDTDGSICISFYAESEWSMWSECCRSEDRSEELYMSAIEHQQ